LNREALSPAANTTAKRLLLFATKLGYQTKCFEDAARQLGVQLTYVTDRCHQLEDPWGDQAIPVHFESPEKAAYVVKEKLRGREVTGVLALGDRPAVAAAYAARALGIPYNHPAAVEACRSKLRTLEVFRNAGLPVPWFRSFPIAAIPEPALVGVSFPCVVKPLSLSASQGVMRANNRDEFLAAASRLRRLLQSAEIRATREPNLDQMIVEGYVPGREVAVEGLLTDGALRILAIFDKPDPLEGPYFEETIYVTPSRLPESTQKQIEKCVEDATRALGLTDGPIHAEFRTNGGGIWPMEVAARPIGGLCARALRFSISEGEPVGLEELLLRHAFRMTGSDAPRETEASGVMMIPVPHSGILESVSRVPSARATHRITDLVITARLHDYIAAWPEGSSYLGFLFATGNTPEEVERALREAHRKLRFRITPRLPVEHPATHRMPAGG
jgi:ATP-grasp domain/L-amino acid ligase C-terminal domain 2/ATP-grasp N-terminal domain